MTVDEVKLRHARADGPAEVPSRRLCLDDHMAGTVGDDVITVHEFVWVGEVQRARYGEGGQGDEAVEWLRPVNCPDCIAE
ncbi:hypothetical protein MOV08_26685 [Streptomyces yunnanensis]|uniref:Uncharacterized protein n=1 Tax=Streptomyces yunnanensis TaxID=156453 RepID=A0ABY8ACG4_9ACTN|nr:hypothetical protein [Streptomyces yunnanensis]WEB42483.1 hypothetical protein MOV08_26685 [Streptomyces yunnanensis]